MDTGDSMERPTMDTTNSGTGLPSSTGNLNATWDLEEKYWADNFTGRPYAIGGNAFYERFRPAYRYGWESAQHNLGRPWEDAEPDLRAGWDRYEHRGEHASAWDDIKDAVKDAWDRVTGHAGTDRRD
ncbi:MAG TPA: hypothetical protein VFL95_01150 [Gemmatimonadales bacterium]|jgi:hypothetical protein|nr:hypothetical protein [Gemmatimonadales bacterium]